MGRRVGKIENIETSITSKKMNRMIDYHSFQKIQDRINLILSESMPGASNESVSSASLKLGVLMQKEFFDYLGLKINFDTYHEIKRLWRTGIKQDALASEFSLSQGMISKICNDKLITKKQSPRP